MLAFNVSEMAVRSALPKLVHVLTTICIALILDHQATAQPVAIGPDDISRLQQQTEFSGDWSETDVFDLDKYITLKVTIERLKIPDRAGNVFLWFTLKNQQKLTDEKDLPANQPFQATLQSVDVVEFLQIDEQDFPRGVDAVIRGWPATEKNTTGSVLLVDDINITSSGKTFALHGNNPKMDSKRTSMVSSE
jgi:hypothetical protein